MCKKCLAIFFSASLILLSGCGKKEETDVKVTPEPTAAQAPLPTGINAGTISLGKAIDPDKKISAPSEAFAKADTIYATVDTTGTGTATLKAKWTYRKDGQTTIVKEDSQTISPTGLATTEFHISKPDGWPVGDYQVELFLDEKPIGVRNFTVK